MTAAEDFPVSDVDVLLRAGLSEDKLPIEGLTELVMRVSLVQDAFMESMCKADGIDVRSLYIAEDGGNG